jgi:hypothetical protein
VVTGLRDKATIEFLDPEMKKMEAGPGVPSSREAGRH